MRRNRQSGFTAIELVVVVVIVVIVLGLTVNFARRMDAQNEMNGCLVKLKALGEALRLYRLDEGDVPLWDPANRGGPGLWALVDLNYLSGPRFLNCPSNPTWTPPTTEAEKRSALAYQDPQNPNYNGYQMQDPLTGEWPYLPDRSNAANGGGGYDTITAGSGYYLRQMGHQRDPADPSRITFRVTAPADRTVVVWCWQHRNKYSRRSPSGKDVGCDQVLYADGHVEVRLEPEDPTDYRAMLPPVK